MPAPKPVLDLVSQFRRNRDSYDDSHYNETQTRIQFLNPLFRALGWDVDNTAGYAEAYKDVVHEDAVKVGGATKAPDYSFRVGGTRKFFLEAKKPAINIKDDADPAFQLRRYAWSAKLPISVVSNFASLAIYDCRAKPSKDDKASSSRIHYWTCDQYASKWADIEAILSKESVLKGSFDRFTATAKGKHGTAEVDSEFLIEIEDWRERLAKNIALRNPKISQRELNFAVQQTIDRIIFLRICEDRGIEHYGNLLALQTGENIYDRLKALFRQADDRYNSGLFHFQAEKGRGTPPDELTLALKIDDKDLKDLFKRLYYPDSPYEFSVISGDILGQVYEQFLGKVIRLTSGGHAKVDDKPEVKKAGGVYYTPTYVVDYIVKNTLGKLLVGKTPKTLKRLSVLDPACGSGSFLLVAYQHLLDWYLKYYAATKPDSFAKGKNAKLFKVGKNEWRLTSSERKRILLQHIFGVDIDLQAVEVTKLSLLLKVLEGEKAEGLPGLHYRERLLPDLDNNIKCGNSLIDADFTAGLFGIDPEDRYRINPFNWEAEFPEIFKGGKFDAVIGNPPYGAFFGPDEKDYLFRKYSAIRGQPESYEYFILRALDLAAKSGAISFIVPTNFTESDRASGIRERLLLDGHIQTLSNFRYNVWKANAAETLVFVFRKGEMPGSTLVVHPTTPEEFARDTGGGLVDPKTWRDLPGMRFLLRADTNIIGRIQKHTVPLSSIGDVSQGIIVYETDADSTKNAYISSKPRGLGWKKLLDTNSTVTRYGLDWGGSYLKYGDWLCRPRNPKYFEEPKILFVRLRNKTLARKLVATLDEKKYYNRDNFNNIILKDARYSLKYVLGLFNSTLINYWYKSHFDNVNINPAQVRLIPIRKINFSNKKDFAVHSTVTNLVTKLLELEKQRVSAKTAHDKTVLDRQFNALNSQLDKIIYELYGIDADAVRAIEGT
jgi:predicted type IV restriction endonuclease